jgi:dihydropteroate synthase
MTQAATRFNARIVRCDSEHELRSALAAVGADPRGVDVMLPKARFYLVKLEGLKYAAASILKQELLSKGGDAAVSGEIYYGGENASDVLLMATERALRRVINVLRIQPLSSMQTLAGELDAVLRAVGGGSPAPMRIGQREFVWGARTYIMGIVNATPDSFSGDGLLSSSAASDDWVERAVAQGLRFLEEGADILDVGGESTRPGADLVDAATELARVTPVIEALRRHTDAPISIDTYKAAVARAALDAGADLVNDIWALQMDPAMPVLVADSGAPVVLMHNRSRPRNTEQSARLGGRYVGVEYKDLLADVMRELRQCVEAACAGGIARERILIDPGIGFGKTVEQNLRLLNHLDELRVLGLPILLGTSRKGFVGYTLDAPPNERSEGTAATVAVGIVRGADIVRVHDVRAMARVAKMTDALVRG